MIASLQLPAPSVEEVADWMRLFSYPGGCLELRAVKVQERYGRPRTYSGYFDAAHLGDLAASALELSRRARAVYVTLNPVRPELLARRYNRVAEVEEKESTSDAHILRRRWLLVDFDPVRVEGIGSSDDEKEAARLAARSAFADLVRRGWPEPVVADSGNGYHLLLPADWPAEDSGLARRVLNALADRYDTPTVKVDRSVFNPARVTKLYGTWARKGDDVPDRPHRVSRILHIPKGLDL